MPLIRSATDHIYDICIKYLGSFSLFFPEGCGASRAEWVAIICQTCFTKVGSQKDKFVKLCFEPSGRLCDECSGSNRFSKYLSYSMMPMFLLILLSCESATTFCHLLDFMIRSCSKIINHILYNGLTAGLNRIINWCFYLCSVCFMYYVDVSASCKVIVSHGDATVATDRCRQQPKGVSPLMHFDSLCSGARRGVL